MFRDPSGRPNQYVTAIQAVGEIIQVGMNDSHDTCHSDKSLTGGHVLGNKNGRMGDTSLVIRMVEGLRHVLGS